MSTISRNRAIGVFRSLAVLMLSALTAACAPAARTDLMTTSNLIPAYVDANPSLRNSVYVLDVIGGKDSVWVSQVGNSDFRNALENSLQSNLLLAAIPADAPYAITAELLDLEQPLVGLNLTVTSSVSYQVTEKGGSEMFMNEEVVTPFTASFGSSLMASERLRLANEGAIRANISEFVKRFVDRWAMRTKRDGPGASGPIS